MCADRTVPRRSRAFLLHDRRRAALPLPPGDEQRARGRGALPRRSSASGWSRATGGSARSRCTTRPGVVLGGARADGLPAPARASSSAARSTSSSSRGSGRCRGSTTSASRSTTTSSSDVLERATRAALRVQEYPGRRTFVATDAGYRRRGAPAARLDRRAARRTRTSCGSRSCSCAPTTRTRRRSALGELLGARRSETATVVRRRDGRALPAERPARAGPSCTPSSFEPRQAARLARELAEGRTYEAAGVSLAAAEAVVERLRGGGRVDRRDRVRRLRRALPARRAAAARRLDRRRRHEARCSRAERGALRDCGARPGRALHQRRAHDRRRAALPARLRRRAQLDLEQVAELVEGAAEVCREAGCALIGGETAELPGRLPRGASSTSPAPASGSSTATRLIDGSRCEPGDVVLGLPSSGLHANGFSLVRAACSATTTSTATDLLAPHRLYLDEVRALRERADVKALAHVTGGGILGNLPRVLPEGVARRDRLGLVGAAAGLRVARRAGRRRGRAAARLQPRDRHVRRRPGRRRRREP